VREDGALFPAVGGEWALVPLEGIAFALRGGGAAP
jgi:hypothetical protein